MPAPPPDAAALCRSCNLCCNGVLFSRAAAAPDELGRMAAAGASLDLGREKPHFRQPCVHSREDGCAIYAERYRICRAFRCALLRRLEAGEVAADEAARLVAEARRAAARDPALAMAEARRLGRLGGAPGPEAGLAARQAWLQAAALDRFLDRHFRNKPVLEWGEPAAMSAEEPDA